ncbi:MAG: nucleoside triphosphate pyrophosphohydrolase [Clostridia bacterium]|nr:nucleoside triphosphate pyrophosphohydrolase [Clostridia bacterium]
MKKVYNKLVRDLIPDIIRSKGEKCNTRVLDDKEYLIELNKKLLEEVNEYLDSEDINEVGDVYEVLLAIIEAKGYSFSEFDKIRNDKTTKRGAFKNKIFLIDTE